MNQQPRQFQPMGGAHEAGRVILASEPSLRLGGLTIEPARRRVAHDDGREQVIEPRVMQVLVALTRAESGIVTRDQLLAACWHGVVVGEDAIDRVISRLRRLGDALGAFTLETITKVGYRLVAASPPTAVDGPAPDAEPCKPSICVLPFANMSDDPQQEYFSDGITEDIITDLSKVSSLFVVARTTSFGMREKNLDAAAVARQMNVGHVLEGSVRRAQGRVRITAQLVDGATGGHVWAERYDRDLQDIFAVQDEISEAIVRALSLKLLPREKRAIEQRGTTRPEAYDLYLLARRYYATGHEGETRELQVIVRLCQRACELDPGYARAWALLAMARTALSSEAGGGDEEGLAAAERAIALDPWLAEARAIRGRHLWRLGRSEEARAEIATALRLDPDCWEVQAEAGRLSYVEHRFGDAIGYLERATAISERYAGAGMLMSSYHAVGDEEGARRAARVVLARAERALAQDHVNVAALCCAVGASAVLQDAERAWSLLERGLLIAPDRVVMRYNFACGLSAYLHDPDAAFRLLAPVFETITPGLLDHARIDPDFDPIRGDPRFGSLVAAAEARLGLAEAAASSVR